MTLNRFNQLIIVSLESRSTIVSDRFSVLTSSAFFRLRSRTWNDGMNSLSSCLLSALVLTWPRFLYYTKLYLQGMAVHIHIKAGDFRKQAGLTSVMTPTNDINMRYKGGHGHTGGYIQLKNLIYLHISYLLCPSSQYAYETYASSRLPSPWKYRRGGILERRGFRMAFSASGSVPGRLQKHLGECVQVSSSQTRLALLRIRDWRDWFDVVREERPDRVHDVGATRPKQCRQILATGQFFKLYVCLQYQESLGWQSRR